jgi:hypothetical protein
LAALPRELQRRVHYCLMGRDKRLSQWQQRARDICGLGNRLHSSGQSTACRVACRAPMYCCIRHCMKVPAW